VEFRFRLVWLVLATVLLSAGCDNKDSNTAVSANHVADTTTLLATVTDEGQLQPVDPSLGMGLHTPQLPSFQPVFSTHGGGVAYRVDKGDSVYVVHNGHPGTRYDAVGAIALSPDGRRIAYGALAAGKWRMIIDGKEGAGFSTVKSPLFSPDGRHLAYQAMSGEKWYLVVDATPNAGTQTRILDHQFSADSSKIAYIDNGNDKNRGRLVISDLAFTQQATVSPSAFRMILNQEGTRIAAITLRDNKQHIVECSFDRPDAIKTGPQYSEIHNPAFGPDGITLAYAAERDGGNHMLVLNDREETLPDGESLVERPVVRPDQKGVGTLISAHNQAFFQQFFLDGGKRENSYDEADGLTYNRDGSTHAYAARKGATWFVVANGVEGTGFDRVISPKFSPNGKYLVYRARKDGRRFVVVANKAGKILRQHPAYEQVFDVTFTTDGKSVAYGVKDGQKLVWQVEAL
jgi:Tol biopolymer transport system component